MKGASLASCATMLQKNMRKRSISISPTHLLLLSKRRKFNSGDPAPASCETIKLSDNSIASAGAPPPVPILIRAAAFLDSFHDGGAAAATNNRKANPGNDSSELSIWRLRCLVVVSWSCGASGAMLVPLYLLGNLHTKLMGCLLLAGSAVLFAAPIISKRHVVTFDQAATLVAGTALTIMTVLSIGSGGFPMGLAPGIQRILPILVLCFGSMQLGIAVTVYVICESILYQIIGPITPVIDDPFILNLIIGGSWVFQPIILLLLGISLHMAGSQTIAALRELSDAKARFLSVVSHELRTPIHGILGTCELAQEGSDASTREALETVHSVASHLGTIVEDLLLYSSSSCIRMQSRRFGIPHLFQTTEATLRATATAMGCSLSFVIPPNLLEQNLHFMGDELRLRQILINVANNAIKYGSVNKSAVVVRLDAVTDDPVDALTTLEFSVEDTGPGIAEKDMDRIFKPFEQGGTDLSQFAGVGLGLSLVSELLAKMNGGIRCESTVGKGSIFYMTTRCPRAKYPCEESSRCAEIDCFQINTTNQLPPTKSPLLMHSQQPAKSVSSVGNPKGETVAEPITFLSVDALDLSRMSETIWIGEEGMFKVESIGNCWSKLVPSILHNLTADVIAFDGSKQAEEVARHVRDLIEKREIHEVTLLRISENRSSACPDCFDATFHPVILPGVARSWHRSLALGAWILVVDDVALNRKILRSQLTKLGHRVTEAVNGLEACEAVEASGFAMDMIAMDIMMPIMDGKTAAKRIREAEQRVTCSTRRPCPIFAVTAGDVSLIEDELGSAFTGLLRKPTTAKGLRSMVRYQVIQRMLERR